MYIVFKGDCVNVPYKCKGTCKTHLVHLSLSFHYLNLFVRNQFTNGITITLCNDL